MPGNVRVHTFCQSQTSIGSFTTGIRQPTGRPLTFQLDVNSANVTLMATNAFSFDNGTSAWFTAVTSGAGLTASGLFFLDAGVFAAYRLLINSVAGHVSANIAE